MNTEALIGSFTREDMQGLLRSQAESSSGTDDELKGRVKERTKNLSWKFLLLSVSKESLQRICGSNGLRSDLSKDELIDQIARAVRSSDAKSGTPLRDLGSPWHKWGTGSRGSR